MTRIPHVFPACDRLRRQLLASSSHEPGSSLGSALFPPADRDYVYPVGTRSSDAHSSMNIGNLFTAAEPPAQGERFEELLSCRNLRIERIVSSSSIVSSEYNQEQDEWVALLAPPRPAIVATVSMSAFVASALGTENKPMTISTSSPVKGVGPARSWLWASRPQSAGARSGGRSAFESGERRRRTGPTPSPAAIPGAELRTIGVSAAPGKALTQRRTAAPQRAPARYLDRVEAAAAASRPRRPALVARRPASPLCSSRPPTTTGRPTAARERAWRPRPRHRQI